MSPIVHVARVTGGANLHQVESRWINQPSSSVTSSDGKSDKPSTLVRASTPSKYLRRRGLVPNGANLQINVPYKNSTVSSSSSTITSPTSVATSSTIFSNSSTVHQDTPCLPNLTECNLAKLMKQLNLLGRSHHIDRSLDLTPQTAIEVSYFSDGSSTHCDSDFE
ncbi:hypothetical protein PTTG_28997 [Puccinia triticina 1-1 BBBD Race 1]|uniref:Uncharacterized protein n=2 Tax=Puccinia triticina TaxID=208348 RepID=A0A180G7H9_PUCT1|nr:uncharacterized protein PtA15_14A17 [Puccinia triticina]OAV88564.1 hypothetical protein PTTG_28997 [Puccinia triticina 1-1 BBBD Race 1]WAQ91137.1 hypothetical protein PtA15_14A17 [Puccinia triticina]WAR61929.1 hypothetical protein PtB15_14B20 [Puccinia triticina]WAR61930.1 hypothetical protein PtB15_14B21 [Puccinia triticina]